MRQRGFTLLEMLVATLIMGVAVVGLLSNLSTSLSNAARLTDYDRAALLAKRKMDELLLDPHLPRMAVLEGKFDPAVAGGVEAGWKAHISPFESPPEASPGITILDRVELEVWWQSGASRKSFQIEAYRPFVIPQPVAGGGA